MSDRYDSSENYGTYDSKNIMFVKKRDPLYFHKYVRCVGIILNQKEMTNFMVRYLKELNRIENQVIPDAYIGDMVHYTDDMITSKGTSGCIISSIPFIRSEYWDKNITGEPSKLMYFNALCKEYINSLKILNHDLISTTSKKKWDDNLKYDEYDNIVNQYLYILPLIDQPITLDNDDIHLNDIGKVIKDKYIGNAPDLETFVKAHVGSYLSTSFHYKTRIVAMEYSHVELDKLDY